MTVTLLAILGLVWCLLLALIVRWLHRLNSRQYWRHAVLPVLSVVAMVPLLGEYLTYYDFRKYCDLHAGMVVNTPVETDKLLVVGWHEFVADVMRAKAVRNVVWENQRDGYPLKFVDSSWEGLQAPSISLCRNIKTLENGERMGSYLHFAYDDLLTEGICLAPARQKLTPRFRFEMSFYPDRFMRQNGYMTTRNTVDSRMLLIDTQSGRVMSEYRNISTPTGSFLNGLMGRYWSRYSCEEHSTWAGAMIWDKRLQVTEFLDRALSPSGD